MLQLFFQAQLQCLTVSCLVLNGMAMPVIQVPDLTGNQDTSAPYRVLPAVTTSGVEVCGHVTCDRQVEFCDRTLVYRCLPCARDCSPGVIRGQPVFRQICLRKCPVYMQSMSSTTQVYTTSAATDHSLQPTTTRSPQDNWCRLSDLSSPKCKASLEVIAALGGISLAVLLFMALFVWFVTRCCKWRVEQRQQHPNRKENTILKDEVLIPQDANLRQNVCKEAELLNR